jgi:hypothetical protein
MRSKCSGNLGGSAHLVEFRHQARLAPSGVVLMDNVLAGNPIEHAQRVANGQRRDLLIAFPDRDFRFLHVRAGRRNVRPVALAASLGDTNALLRGLGIGQLEIPLAVWLQNIRHTAKYGARAATSRWYQTEAKSTTTARSRAVVK